MSNAKSAVPVSTDATAVEAKREDFRVGLYEHYRGGRYNATGLSRHHDTREFFVEYVSLTTGEKCTREYATPGKDSWTDLVTWPDSVRRARFSYAAEQPQ